MNINRATFVPIVPPENPVHRTKPVSANKINGQTKRSHKSTTQDTSLSGEHVREHVCEQVERLVLVCNGEMSEKDLREAVRVKNRPNFTVRYLARALEGGYIERTASGTRSPNQNTVSPTRAGRLRRSSRRRKAGANDYARLSWDTNEREDGEPAADSYCVFDDRQVAVVGEEMVKYGKSRARCAA